MRPVPRALEQRWAELPERVRTPAQAIGRHSAGCEGTHGVFVDGLNREWRVDALLRRAGSGGPLVAGAAFAVAWTPCVGPTLGAILSAAALSESAGHGALLLALYSAGLAIPFLATALAFGRMTALFASVRGHFPLVIAAGGGILVVMGVLIWTGELLALDIEAQRLMDRLGLDFVTSVWAAMRDALAYCARREHLRRTVRIALVVGVVLTAINQADVIASGHATATTWLKCALNFVVPFIVSNLGLLSGRTRGT